MQFPDKYNIIVDDVLQVSIEDQVIINPDVVCLSTGCRRQSFIFSCYLKNIPIEWWQLLLRM